MSDASIAPDSAVKNLRWGPILLAGLVSIGLAAAVNWILDILLATDWAVVKNLPFRNQLGGLKSTAWAGVIPFFIFLREAFQQASPSTAATAPAGKSPSYRFWMFGLTSGLVIVLLTQGLGFLLSILHQLIAATLVEKRIPVDEDTAIRLLFMLHSIILPIVFAVALAVGWSMHRRKIQKPILCALVCTAMVFAMRLLDVWLIGELLQKNPGNPGMLLTIAGLPALCLVGVLLAYFIRAAGSGLATAMSSRLAARAAKRNATCRTTL